MSFSPRSLGGCFCGASFDKIISMLALFASFGKDDFLATTNPNLFFHSIAAAHDSTTQSTEVEV